MKTFTWVLSVATVLFSAEAYSKGAKSPAGLTESCQEVASQLNEGDVVFVEIQNEIFKKVAQTQNHWANHVGLAFQEPNGDWYVVESTIPVSKKTPLCSYLKKGYGAHIAVKRLKEELNRSEVEALRESAESRLDILYHLGFKFESNRQFCSKLVYESYLEALGIEIGKKESFRELLNNTQHREEVLPFWRKWYFGFIPWSRKTVTPASQYFDDELRSVIELEF